MSDQHVLEAATYITHNKHNREHSCTKRDLTRDPNNQAAGDLHLRPHAHRDCLLG